MTSTVLVIGGSGFTGQRVVDELLLSGARVISTARSEASAEKLRALGAIVIRADLDQTSTVRTAMKESGAERLVVVASLGFGHAHSLVDVASEVGFDHTVFVSTTAIFTTLNATSRAGRLAAEAAIRESSLSWTLIRPTMIYGAPGDRNMERLVRCLRWLPIIPLPNGGKGLQQPVHVSDLAVAIRNAAFLPTGDNTAYNVPGPEPISFRDIVSQTCDALDSKRILLSVPASPLRSMVELVQKSRSWPHLTTEQVDRLLEDKVFDPGAAIAQLRYAPRPFATGIQQEVDLIASASHSR